MLAIQHSNHLALDKFLQTNCTLFLRFANLHLLYTLQTLSTQTHQLLLETLLLQTELQRILQHQIVKRLRIHTHDRRMLRNVLPVVVSIDNGLVLVLPVDEIEVVLTSWVELNRSI